MAGTRRSTRLGGSQGSQDQPSSSPKAKAGSKRKAAASSPSSAKKNKKAQKTLEQTMPELEKDESKDVEMADGGEVKQAENNGDAPKSEANDVDVKMPEESSDAVPKEEKTETKVDEESKEALDANMDVGEGQTTDDAKIDSKDPAAEGGAETDQVKPIEITKDDETEAATASEPEPKADQSMKDSEPAKDDASASAEESKQPSTSNAEAEDLSASNDTQAKASDPEPNPENKQSTEDKASAEESEQPAPEAKSESNGASNGAGNGNLVEEKHARDDKVASNIVEKGIIYFFTRGRVNVEEPEGVQDLQRSFFVLRPIPTGAKLGDGAIDDSKNNRLLALPKKVFPESGRDKFMAFVEKAKVSMSELKKEFFSDNSYETKAGDSRHTPAVTPIGEGVYAITAVGRDSHLAYMLTIPKEPGELQKEIGIYEKGSFALSLKNPKNKGPANTQLQQSPDFPESVMSDFRGLAWMPVHKSEYLDYANAQLLLIGEGAGRFGGGAVEAPDGQKGEDAEKELERLEGEDEVRVEALNGDDAVFEDLHVRKGEYFPDEVKTTWS